MGKDEEAAAADVFEVGGRIAEPPTQTLIGTAFAAELEAHRALSAELGRVDLAHVLCLLDGGVIPSKPGADLLRAILELEDDSSSFSPEPSAGDAYTNREARLAALTPHLGWLGTGRARREATTTAYHIVLRQRLLALDAALSSVGRALATCAGAHRETLMPDYTYLQAGQPTTFGHYVSSFVFPVLRDRQRLREAFDRVDRSPAGCGSANGSTLLQDRAGLARRLGFGGIVQHARDAMWQADSPIELLALVCAAMVGLDRLAEDLMLFAATDLGFVRLADRHVRASKIMPQKRNPFPLAYMRAVANRCLGVQAAVTAAGRTPSGQMDNRLVPYGEVPAALDAATGASTLLAEVVEALTVDAARARAVLDASYALSTDLAEGLVAHLGIDFRTAHRAVGRVVTKLSDLDRPLSSLTSRELRAELPDGLPALDESTLAKLLRPEHAIAARGETGCAGPKAFEELLQHAERELLEGDTWAAAIRKRLREADRALMAEARDRALKGD